MLRYQICYSDYEKNYRDCEHHEWSYYINDENGYVSVKLAPDTDSEVAVLMNGEVVYVLQSRKRQEAVRVQALLSRLIMT